MISQPTWFREHFALSHAVVSVFIYTFAIVVPNVTKSYEELIVLVERQAIMTFIVTGFVVRVVERFAVKDSLLLAAVAGVFFPATCVAFGSLAAHWWTEEIRNVFAPFLLSIFLNSCLVVARRAGNETLSTQLHWFCKKIRLIQ